MKRSILAFTFSIIALIITLISLSWINATPEAQAQGNARMWVAHLAPFANAVTDTAVSVDVNGNQVLSDLRFGETSGGYLTVPAGGTLVEIKFGGSTAISGTFDLMADTDYTIAAIGNGLFGYAGLELYIVDADKGTFDDNTAPSPGNGKVRVVHLAPFSTTITGTTIDVRTDLGGLAVMTNVKYLDSSGYVELPTGTYDLQVTDPGGGNAVIDIAPFDLAEGEIVTVFASGDGVNQILGILPIVYSIAEVYVVHAAPFTSTLADTAVTVRINGQDTITDLKYLNTSGGYISLPSLSTTVEILTGNTVVASDTYDLLPNTKYTVAAIGNDPTTPFDNLQPIELLALVDEEADSSLAKLRIVHAAPFSNTLSGTEVDLRFDADDSVVAGLTNVQYKVDSGYLPLSPDTYDTKVTTPGGDAVVIDLPPLDLKTGDILTIFAVGDDKNRDFSILTVPPIETKEETKIYLPFISKPLTPNGTRPQSIEVLPTIRSASIVSVFASDENGNNFAKLYYREVEARSWLEGPAMTKEIAVKEWRGSLVLLNPDTEYEIEIRYEDNDGVSPSTLHSTVRTLPDYPDVGNGGKIFTVPTDGSLSTVVNKARPGDTIQLLGGIYQESVTLEEENSGAPGKYITIEPAPGATVIFDGSTPSLNGTGDNWIFYASSSKGDIYYTDLSFGDTNFCGSNALPGYVGQLFNEERVRYLLFDSEDDWNNDFLTAPAGKAYYVCNNSGPGPMRRLYVVTISGDDPDNQEMHVAQQTRGIYLRGADYIRIRGLQFRHYSWSAIQLGNSSQLGADYNVIEDNMFHGIGEEHIRINGKEGQAWTIHNLIQNNHFSEGGYRDLGWEWSVAYPKARSGISYIFFNFTGPGNVVRDNIMESGHDGIQINRESDNVDVYNNTISECMDNAIEVDNNPGQNIRIWGNTINYCYAAISLQDWNNNHPGPVYIFRNVLRGGDDPQNRTDQLGGTTGYVTYTTFKVGADKIPTGFTYIYHNTISLLQSTNSGAGIRDSGGNYFANITTRNNIWNVSGRVFYFNSPNSILNHDFDCDNMHDLDPSDNKFVQWIAGTNYTNLATFQAQTGQELNGISKPTTIFDSNLRLQAGSPDIDAGCLVPGFNDDYRGAAPDLGAFEFQP